MLWRRCCWSTLCRLETLDRQLHDRKTSFSSFDADAKEFLAWLTRAEVAVSHYEEMAVTDLSASEEQQNKSQRAFNVRILYKVVFPKPSWPWAALIFVILAHS